MRAALCEEWPALLSATVAACERFHDVIVLRETDSTQDAAIRLGAVPGMIVTAFRQTLGRGRLGRAWADTGEEGVAITFITTAAPPERLAVLSAVAACRAAEALLAEHAAIAPVAIRWPNDVMAAGRKLAGILIEQDAALARIGIGINIAQRSFAGELAERACSFAQLGVHVDRVRVMQELIRQVDAALAEPTDDLARAFAARDALCGRRAVLEFNRKAYAGHVVSVDPLRGLCVATAEGDVFLPAHATSLVSVE